ncbi:MAG: hypothetical protein B1H40_00140 [Candidatus Latescibacteria bacterium 4484_181]|nr:MAG: hypothetical protein B1H40_00140 [Candidatus Latescibacteria bacterium 4484_181]
MIQQLVVDYKITFNSEHGRHVLADLEEFAGYNKPCFSKGFPDETAFMLGQRNIILRIKRILAEREA